MDKWMGALQVGLDYVKNYPEASRFEVAIFLHGYNARLSFNQLTVITRDIGIETNKPINW